MRTIGLALTGAVVVLAAPAVSSAASLKLDKGFADGGRFVGGQGVASAIFDSAAGPAGRLYFGGQAGLTDNRQLGALLFATDGDGSLEPSFAEGGLIQPLGQRNEVQAVVPLPDGRVLVAGTTIDDTSQSVDEQSSIVVARLLPNGQPDPAFGNGGNAAYRSPDKDVDVVARTLVRQSDGKLVVVGTNRDEVSGRIALFAVRFTAAGQLDPTFGQGGTSTVLLFALDADNQANVVIVHDAALAEDDAIVVAGGLLRPNGVGRALVARLARNGGLDKSFNKGNGFTTRFAPKLPSGPVSNRSLSVPTWRGVAFDQQRGIVLVGDVGRPTAQRIVAARMRADGAGYDPGFGKSGYALLQVGKGRNLTAADIALRPGGAVAICGSADIASPNQTSRFRFLIAGFTASGKADPGFGSTGGVQGVTLTEVAKRNSFAETCLVDTAGRPVVAGLVTDRARSSSTLGRDLAIVRYRKPA